MFESRNFKDDMAKAIVLREEFQKYNNLKDKFSRFSYLFPSFEDKVVCKVIFDLMFTSDGKQGKFIDQMLNAINKEVPQNFTEMIDVYSQASAWVMKEKELAEKIAADNGGERWSEEVKQGSSKYDDKYGRTDTFIVMGTQNPNNDFVAGQIVEQKGEAVVSTLSKEELEVAKAMNDKLQKDKEDAQKLEEARKREAYEESLRRRNNKKNFANIAGSLERVYSNKD